MKTLSKVMLLSLALPLVSCNEKVSSQLQNSASSTGSTTGSTTGGSSGGSSGGTPQNNYTFEVSITTPAQAGHVIHRTGFSFDGATYTSRKTTPCKVTSPDNVPFSNAIFDAEAALAHDARNYDISCFVEVEELALYLNGVEFEVKASPNACEIVSYSPFAYFSYMPGDSTTTYNTVKCPEGWTGPGPNHVPVPGDPAMNCSQWRDTSFSTNIASIPEDDVDLCRFNYTSEEGPNCDIGTVTIQEANYIDDPGAPGTLIRDPSQPTTIRTQKCGGKVFNCLNGAVRKGSGMNSSLSFTNVIYHENTTKDTSYSKRWSLPALIDEGANQLNTNRPYINYRRELSNPKYDYDDYLNPSYADAFSPVSNGFPNLYETTFEPALMGGYANNRKMNLTGTYVTAAEFTAFNTANNYISKPIAAEPFMSVDPKYRINPYYTFYCLNKSYENKARIRIVIREWDRLFGDPSTNNNFDYLTDIFLGSDGLLDNDTFDSYGEPYNDFEDWDDFIKLVRSPGSFDDANTEYEPILGPFHQDNFPKDL